MFCSGHQYFLRSHQKKVINEKVNLRLFVHRNMEISETFILVRSIGALLAHAKVEI